MSATLPDRFAILSDIHGNLFALDAVLADIRSQAVTETVNLGDHLQGPLDPVGTAERLMPLGLPSIRGNCDRHLFEEGTVAAPGSTLAANRHALSPQHKHWLASMPQTLTLDDVLLCHGTPWADDVYLLEEVTPQGARIKRTEEIAPILDGIAARLVLCGHSHQGRTIQMLTGTLVVNPGSVGLPLTPNNRHIRTEWRPAARTRATRLWPDPAIAGRSSIVPWSTTGNPPRK